MAEAGSAPGSAASVAAAAADPVTCFQPDARCRSAYPKKEGSCHFFLAHKGRYCNIRAIDGILWCGNHLPNDDEQQQEQQQEAKEGESSNGSKSGKKKRRVPCPVDPSHTIYAHNLKGHVRVCTRSKENAEVAAEPFYRQDANSGAPSPSANPGTSSSGSKGPIMAVDDLPAFFARAQALVEARRSRLFPSTAPDEVQQLMEGPAARILAQIEANGWANAQGRHVVQQASIVSHLHRRGLLDGSTTVVELGAGRGSLGLAVKLAFPAAALVMVERSGVKFKSDKWLRKMETESNANANVDAEASSCSLSPSASSFRRLRMDLRHLYIQGLGLPADGRLAFVGKHVCGVATDLSLRAVAAFLRERASSSFLPLPAVGVGIACCCYHVCRWDDYVGKEVWEEEFGWARTQFEVVQRCACWVSSSYGELNRQEKGRREGEEEAEVVEAAAAATEVVEAPEHEVPEEAEGGGYGRGLSVQEKLTMGRVCKRLIDYGRLEYLRRACGLEGEIVTYCEPSVSPENTCILAWTATASKPSSE